MTGTAFDRVLADRSGALPFALLHRPATTGADTLEVVVGEVSTPDTLAEIPLPDGPSRGAGPCQDTLVIIPYRQITKRGFDCTDDGAPLIAMTITGQETVPVAEALARIPGLPTGLSGGHFFPDDDSYADIVRRVISDEIGQGEGANFVISRSFVADITGYTPRSALTLFRRLLVRESGGYWTFVIHTGDRTFVGTSPERHMSLAGGTAVMNPISGTYRYPPSGPTLSGVLAFLEDRKETDELYMVVDEELKMMARVCAEGGRVTGPYLREMGRLAHTEYLIEGRSDRSPLEVLHETMFAPTVTGSPLQNACRVIKRYEPQGRGYYSGVAALIGRDEHGDRTMDSAILIRTGDIDSSGQLRIGVGATLVRHSDPETEAAETRAKAAALLSALEPEAESATARFRAAGTAGHERFAGHSSVQEALGHRNDRIARFWLSGTGPVRPEPGLAGIRTLVIDAEDTFTSMIAHQLRSTGMEVTLRQFDEAYSFRDHDLVVMGPGPGDPRDTQDFKILRLRLAIRRLLDERRRFLAVCLSHQILSQELGLGLIRKTFPNQGVQREIDFFGTPERVGFYNTFAAVSTQDKIRYDNAGLIEVSRDLESGEVHALSGPHFASLQFHAESLLTPHGVDILADTLREVLES